MFSFVGINVSPNPIKIKAVAMWMLDVKACLSQSTEVGLLGISLFFGLFTIGFVRLVLIFPDLFSVFDS